MPSIEACSTPVPSNDWSTAPMSSPRSSPRPAAASHSASRDATSVLALCDGSTSEPNPGAHRDPSCSSDAPRRVLRWPPCLQCCGRADGNAGPAADGPAADGPGAAGSCNFLQTRDGSSCGSRGSCRWRCRSCFGRRSTEPVGRSCRCGTSRIRPTIAVPIAVTIAIAVTVAVVRSRSRRSRSQSRRSRLRLRRAAAAPAAAAVSLVIHLSRGRS